MSEGDQYIGKTAAEMRAAHPSLFGETAPPREVPVTRDVHKLRVGEYLGMAYVLDALEKIPETKRVPGFAHALAIVEREVADARAKLLSDNLRAVAAAGHDINLVQRVDLQGFTLLVETLDAEAEA